MKRILFIIAVLLLVVGCQPIQPGKAAVPGTNFLEKVMGTTEGCFDSDQTRLMANDESYFINGYVSSLDTVYNDLCENGELREFYCDEGVRSVKIECSYGCGEGAFCKKQPTQQ